MTVTTVLSAFISHQGISDERDKWKEYYKQQMTYDVTAMSRCSDSEWIAFIKFTRDSSRHTIATSAISTSPDDNHTAWFRTAKNAAIFTEKQIYKHRETERERERERTVLRMTRVVCWLQQSPDFRYHQRHWQRYSEIDNRRRLSAFIKSAAHSQQPVCRFMTIVRRQSCSQHITSHCECETEWFDESWNGTVGT